MFGNAWKKEFPHIGGREYKKRMAGNRQVLAHLTQLGDNPQIARELLHYAYFTNQSDCDAFEKDVVAAGFSARPAQASLGLVVSTNSTTDAAAVDIIVLFLCNAAMAHGGDYDGWETKICK